MVRTQPRPRPEVADLLQQAGLHHGTEAIGNTGVNAADEESSQVHAAGLVIRELPVRASSWRADQTLPEYLAARGVVAIAGLDTRRLTRILREQGAQNGCLMAVRVDEAEAEVVRVEATAIDDLTYGLGVVARLNKGATVTLVRERIDGDTWLPTSIRLSGEGRAMVFRKLRVDHVIEWFDYRRLAQVRVE